ncbi:MAG: ABC transporter ATP-binding protein [Polyangiales bacterium]
MKVIEVAGLAVTFRVGFFMKSVEAVRSISFDVEQGQIVGLIGPNGAGKTTTVKVLMGLCRATKGATKIKGVDSADPESRRVVGYLPESPYVYPYLTPREFVDLCGRLSGMNGAARRKRVPEVLERTGIMYAADRSVGRLSKGMLQRTGLAAALVADPEILVLDEPMSGLDPIGRREVRDLIFEERRLGRTVLFSSHVLSDVEALCDHVVILHKGELKMSGAVSDLVRQGARLTEVTVRGGGDEVRALLEGGGRVLRSMGNEIAVEVSGEDAVSTLLAKVIAAGGTLVSAVPRKDSLEDLFVRNAVG